MGTAEIDTKRKEAEVYYSMGLLEESLGVYEKILSSSDNTMDTQDRNTIEEKIGRIRDEITTRRQRDEEEMSSEGVAMIKPSLNDSRDAKEILENASALIELGLVEDALKEYVKAFDLDLPVQKVLHEFTRIMSKKHSPGDIMEWVGKLIDQKWDDNEDRAEIRFRFALEMESRGNKDLAFNIYKEASKIDPSNMELKERLDSIIKAMFSGSRYDYLLNKKLVNSGQLQKALAISRKTRKSVEFVLIDHFKIPKKEMGKSLSLFYGCPFKGFDSKMPIPVELIRNLKKTFLLHDVWVPINWSRAGVEILVDDPKDLGKTGQISALMKTRKILFCVGIKEDIEQFIQYFFERKREKPVEEMMEELDMIPDISFEEEEDFEEIEDDHDESSSQVVRFVDQFLITAYRKNASDIHIEPSPVTKTTGIRFRLDGVCHEYMQVPNSMARGILSRLKIMAGLDIAERRLPQDGKIKFRRKGVPAFEMRMATIPTTGSFEDAVLRILAKAGAMMLDEMGLSERNLEAFLKILSQPYGLVLVVGPTGSGKTTTLHAALGYINKPGIKIWTAEDPVEITQHGLRQVEIKSKIGLDFARVMRAFLRADPDVIMIGEMRDYETASTGVEASLTGHLVFSTLHTNSAPETVTRLLDMGLNPLNFSDAFLGVLAQRLVRRLCNNCKEKYNLSKDEFEELVKEYGEEAFKSTGIRYSSDIALYRAKGCDECSGSGYKGRMGIHELMIGSNEIKRLVKKAATSEDLFRQAEAEGMTTLKQDGLLKVFQGFTDINEIRRVCIE